MGLKNGKNKKNNNITINYNKNYLTTHLHTLEVFTLLILQDGRLSSSSDDGKLIIYNKNNKDADLIISEHDKDTLSYHIQLKNGNLVTCSYNHSIKIIQLIGKKNYKLFQPITKHTDKVLKILEYKENNIISCSYDKTMKIFILENDIYTCIQSIDINYSLGDDSNLLFIKNHSEILTSSNEKKYIKFWNIKNINDIQLIARISNIPCSIWPNSMTLIGGKLIIGTKNDGIFIINLKKNKIICNVETDIEHICTVISLINGNLMIGGRDDEGQSIIEYKFENDKLIKIKSKYTEQTENIIDIITLNNGNVVTCSMDERIIFFSK